MTVTGTEQRVYGTLVGGCIIDLHRFALVSGSTTQSPTGASSVVYADTTPYRQCGYAHDGFLTLFLSISGSSVYAAVEVYICKNDNKRIVLETYGKVAKTIIGGMALWFNKGTDKHFPTRDDFPETGSSNVNYIDDATDKYYIWNETLYEEGSCWVKLNSTTSGVIMPYAKTSYTFKETKRNGSITIECCKKCPSCGCKACSVQFYVMLRGTSTKIYPTSTLMYGYHDPPYGNQSCLWQISTVPVMTVADWRCLEVDVNVPANVIYDVYFEDPDGDDPLIGSFEWFRSDSNYEIVVEYTIECDDIKVWAYTELDEDNWQLSNLIGRPIRIMDGTGYTNSGTISSVSGTSGIVTIGVPNIVIGYIQYQSGSSIPLTDISTFTHSNGSQVWQSGWLSWQNIQKITFLFNGLLPLTGTGGSITKFEADLHSGSGSWSLGNLIMDLPSVFSGRITIGSTTYMIADNYEYTYTNPHYKDSYYTNSIAALWAYTRFWWLTNYVVYGATLTIDIVNISPEINLERCACRMKVGQRVYID